MQLFFTWFSDPILVDGKSHDYYDAYNIVLLLLRVLTILTKPFSSKPNSH